MNLYLRLIIICIGKYRMILIRLFILLFRRPKWLLFRAVKWMFWLIKHMKSNIKENHCQSDCIWSMGLILVLKLHVVWKRLIKVSHCLLAILCLRMDKLNKLLLSTVLNKHSSLPKMVFCLVLLMKATITFTD